MKRKIKKSLNKRWYIVTYLDSIHARPQSQTQEELDALLPSVLDRAFKGEL